MKKNVTELKKKNAKELVKEISLLREEIAKSRSENKVNAVKDTNLIFKKRKKLAVLLTILTEKESE